MIQPEDRTTDIESDDTEDEDVIEATPSPCEARVEPALANVTPLRKRLPVSTAINNKLDQILENQKILFSMVRSLVREKNDSGFYAGEFGQRAIQILDKGNAEILNQGRDVFSDLGGTQMLDQGRVLPTLELGTVSPNVVELGTVSPTIELGRVHREEEESFVEGSSSGDLEGDTFLAKVIQIKGRSCSVGNFAAKLVQLIFTKGELIDHNCMGRKGKLPLDCDKLDKVKEYVSKMFPVQASQSDMQWKKCVIAIDEFLRRSNKGIIQQQRKP